MSEAGLPPDAGAVKQGDLTIEAILEEKKVFDLNERFEKISLEQDRAWILPGMISLFHALHESGALRTHH